MARIKGRYDVKTGKDGKARIVKGKRRLSVSANIARSKSKKQRWRPAKCS